MIVVVLIAYLGLFFVTPAIPIWLAWTLILRKWRAARVPFGMLCGYLAGAAVVWKLLVPRDWPHSFWTTLRATVDSETFGHPVEHYAECLVVAMLFAAVLGSAAGGAIGGFTARAHAR